VELDESRCIGHHLCAMPKLHIRIDFGLERAIGPGKVRLLEYIHELGSLRKAAAAMKVSYRRAWLLVHAVEGMMGESVVSMETGGKAGGGSQLTDAGCRLVELYRSVESVATFAARAQLSEFEKMAASTCPLRPRRRLKSQIVTRKKSRKMRS